MSEIVELLTRGVGLYEQLVGVSREKTSGKFTFCEYDERQRLEALFEALELDPSGITAVLLLRYFTESKVASCSFNWLDLLRKPELAEQLNLPRQILAVVESPLVTEASDQFKAQLTKALEGYGALDRLDVKALLNKPDELAFLRRDALRSIKNLRVDQFLDGETDPDGTLPVYAKVVHQWWNINSMIEQITRLPSGVSLNLIREPDGYSSYFAFAIRNGGRLFVLSDIEPATHPLRALMSRRPDRDLERRIGRNWFPYDLLNISYTENGRRLYLEAASQCTAVAVRQSATVPLKSVSEMEAGSLVWTAMMFELIVEKFWKKGYRAPALSYTGEMIRQEAALLQVAEKAGLPVPAYEPLGLTPISREVIKQATDEVKDALGKSPTNRNQWMIDRYGDACPEEALNLLALPRDVFTLETNGTAITKFSNNELEQMGLFAREKVEKSGKRLHALSATAFGTREALNKDRIWLARYNWAGRVQLAAEAEYAARKEEVYAWYRERVIANLPNLLPWLGHGKVWRSLGVPIDGFGCHVDVPTGLDTTYAPKGRHGRVYVMGTKERLEYKASGSHSGWWQGFSAPNSIGGEPPCVFTQAKPSYMVTFCPVFASDLAFFAGCAVEDLPDVLQHFDGVKLYSGNHILDRIDPAVSRLHNPWLKLDLRFRIGLSKRGLKKAQSIAATPGQGYYPGDMTENEDLNG